MVGDRGDRSLKDHGNGGESVDGKRGIRVVVEIGYCLRFVHHRIY